MATIAFDTLEFARTLEQAGFCEQQAQAVADAFREAQGEPEIVTKADLREAEHRITADIIKWVPGLLLAQAALVAALVELST